MIHDLIASSRSFRRFHEEERIEEQTLRGLVELARLSPSGGNLQPLKYVLAADPALNARIFPHLRWAGYLREWEGPEPGERPSGYIVILLDRAVAGNAGCDHGIAAQSILLGAREQGLGGCMIGNLDRAALRQVLGLREDLEILLVLALGKPKETVVLTELPPGGGIKYYRDADQVHYVPKRRLEDIILPAPE